MRKLVLVLGLAFVGIACSEAVGGMLEDAGAMLEDAGVMLQDAAVPDAGAQPGGILVECDLELPSGQKYAIVPVENPRTAIIEFCVDEPPTVNVNEIPAQIALSQFVTCVAQLSNHYNGNDLYIACSGWDAIRVFE